jgi:hypothetical protein
MKKTLTYGIVLCAAFLLAIGAVWHKTHTSTEAQYSAHAHIAISLEHPIQDLLDNPACTANGSDILASITHTLPEVKDHSPSATVNTNVMAADISQHCSFLPYKEVYKKARYISHLRGSYFQEIFIPPC